MKKLVFLITAALVLISACGVQKPYAPTISLISGGSAALPFAQQEGMRVQSYSPYDVRIDWNIKDTGAQGVQIIIADGSDYYCEQPLATRSYNITDSSTITSSPMSSLGYMFEASANIFQPGKSFAICICAIMYDSISSPSMPVFLDLVGSSGSLGMGYYY